MEYCAVRRHSHSHPDEHKSREDHLHIHQINYLNLHNPHNLHSLPYLNPLRHRNSRLYVTSSKATAFPLHDQEILTLRPLLLDKTSPFRILASGGTVTGKYLITPNPAGTDYFSNALLVFQGNTTSQATPFTWKDDAPIAPNGYPPTILSSGSADKLRAADFPNQDEESITCTVVGGPGNTCVLQCQNPFDGGRESFEDCYQQDRNWMVGIRAGVDYSSCPLVLPYVVTI